MTGGVHVPPHRCRAVAAALRLAAHNLQQTDRVRPAEWVGALIIDLECAARVPPQVPTLAPPPDPCEGWLSTSEVAHLAGVTRRAVAKAILAGHLQAERQPDYSWRIEPASARRWAHRRQRTAS